MFSFTHENEHGARFYVNLDTGERYATTGRFWWKDTEQSPGMYIMKVDAPDPCRVMDNRSFRER